MRMEIDGNGLEVLHRGEALALLRTREVGRLVYTRAGLPAIAPVNYALHEGAILIWVGSLWTIEQDSRGPVVAFEVDYVDQVARGGWSVCIVGRAAPVTDPRTQQWALQHGPVPWVNGPKEGLIRITAAKVTGRRIGPRERQPASSAPPPRLLHAAASP